MYRIVKNGLIAIPASLYLTPNTQNTRGHGCKFRVPAGCVDAFNYSFLHTVLLFGFGTNCRLLSLCRPPSSTRPSNLDWWASRRLRRQRHSSCFYLTLQHVFFCLWNLDLSFAPDLHAHLPCTTLLNSEECASSEKKKKKSSYGHMLQCCVCRRHLSARLSVRNVLRQNGVS